MTTQPDGGPAFPVLAYKYLASGDIAPEPTIDAGMTLRDYFAGQVLAGFAANPSVFAPNGITGWGLVNATKEELSDYVLTIADAMLAARERKP